MIRIVTTRRLRKLTAVASEVKVLTAERDASVARAEAAEHEAAKLAEWGRAAVQRAARPRRELAVVLDEPSARASADAYSPAPFTIHIPADTPGAPQKQSTAADPLGALRAYVDAWWAGALALHITDEHARRVDPFTLMLDTLAANPDSGYDLLDLLERCQAPGASVHMDVAGLGYRWARLFGTPFLPRALDALMRERYGDDVTDGIRADAEEACRGIVP